MKRISFGVAIAIMAIMVFSFAPVSTFAASRYFAPVHAPAANAPAGSGSSYNWSGYESTSGTYTGIGATWTIPAVSASSSLTADATWVGIGGVTTHDLIQVGTQAVTGNGANQVHYQVWMETLPQSTEQIPLTVNAGDSVTGSVTQMSAGEWQISFTDNTTGGHYTTQIAYASSLNSAEWIEEAPSDQNGIMPLDQFGSVSFTGAYALLNGNRVTISGSGATSLTMANLANQAVAVPSALNADGESFTVSRTSAAATVANAPGIGFFRGRGHRVPVGIQGFVPGRRGNPGNADGDADDGIGSSSTTSSSSTAPTTITLPFGRRGNFGRGQFRIQSRFRI